MMRSLAFDVIELAQGTKEWLEWRKGGIGSSDAPAIMGENPWKSAHYLLREKGKTKTFKNAAMMRGHQLEPLARNAFNEAFDIEVKPACLQNKKCGWLRASVDGIAISENVVVEIKCGEKAYWHAARKRTVPKYYYGQLQHILAVTNLPTLDYYCYLPSLPGVHLSIARDESYIERLLRAEATFWRTYQNL